MHIESLKVFCDLVDTRSFSKAATMNFISQSAVSQQVRVATIYSIGLHELSPVVKKFIKSYPQVNIHIEYSRPNKIYDDVIGGAIDLGIVAYPSARPQIEIVPFRRDRLGLLFAP